MAALPAKRRRLRPEQRREMIVKAAADEFGRRGHRDARLEDIAHAAGTTKAVIYDHFADKDALHAEVVARAAHHLLEAVGTAVGPAGERGARERYRAGILASFALIAQRPDVRTLLLGEPGAPAAVATESIKAQRTARSAMAALYLSEPAFLRGRRNRREHAEHIAQGAIGTINGLAVLGVEQGLTPEHLTGLAMDLLWPGIEAMLDQLPGATRPRS
jgi:AcrR family transcriptional regulator